MNWSNIYQSINQAQQMQQMPFIPINNLPQMNPMMNNMNMNQFSPTEQIQFMAQFYQNQNQNIPQMNMGGNQNLYNNNNFNNMNNNNSGDKINLCFSTLRGARINMRFNPDETIDSVLTKFL